VNSIFIQIASYRDPELYKTIKDCISKAAYPDRLTFGICWQKDDTESVYEFLGDSRFKFYTVNWKESTGVGWARSICNGLYSNEQFTLQIDSHHRFIQNWDILLIDQWKKCNHPKATITGYPPSYEYNDKKEEICHNSPAMTMIVKGFDQGYIPTFKSRHPAKNVDTNVPFRGSFIAGGFIFTVGNICKEVPYIDGVYFIGEEILYSIRVFTFGYRVFYPSVWCLWHMYDRKNNEKHWKNFTADDKLKTTYNDIQRKSVDIIRKCMYGDTEYAHLFGSINTINDFENYAGVSIIHKSLHPKMLKGYEPPFEYVNGWVDNIEPIKNFSVDFDLDVSQIPDRSDYIFWYFGLHDIAGSELYRDDIKTPDGSPFSKSQFRCKKIINVRRPPTHYIIWPYSKEKGWHDEIKINVPENAIQNLNHAQCNT